MKIDILTIFPEFFTSPLSQSLLGKASAKGLVDTKVWDIRDFSTDRHRTVDDEPYGGGAGMVMKIEPFNDCLKTVRAERGKGHTVLLSPQGSVFDQKKAFELREKEHIVLLCGRYEGIDNRIMKYVDEEISIGDYVVMGGETAALVITEAVARLVKGVVGKEESVYNDTFIESILEYPQYTRPPEFQGMKVPDVLLSGNHKEIREWRLYQALAKTLKQRPDLLEKLELDKEKKKILEKVKKDHAG